MSKSIKTVTAKCWYSSSISLSLFASIQNYSMKTNFTSSTICLASGSVHTEKNTWFFPFIYQFSKLKTALLTSTKDEQLGFCSVLAPLLHSDIEASQRMASTGALSPTEPPTAGSAEEPLKAPPLPLCLRLTGFLGHRILSAKTGRTGHPRASSSWLLNPLVMTLVSSFW